MIRVVLVDDHWVVIEGLKAVLATATDIELVGTAEGGDEAVDLVGQLSPDVALMDLSMPDGSGERAIRRIMANGVDTRVVVLTMFGEESRILAAFEAGAVGFLLKDSSPAQILDAIREADAGNSPLDPRAASTLVDALRSGSLEAPEAALSDRELEVLTLVSQGMLNKQIARELEIAESTVKAHLTRIYRQIGVSDRLQAALWAQRNGIGT